jgi:hypothetical protein
LLSRDNPCLLFPGLPVRRVKRADNGVWAFKLLARGLVTFQNIVFEHDYRSLVLGEGARRKRRAFFSRMDQPSTAAWSA